MCYLHNAGKQTYYCNNSYEAIAYTLITYEVTEGITYGWH